MNYKTIPANWKIFSQCDQAREKQEKLCDDKLHCRRKVKDVSEISAGILITISL